MTIEVTSSQIKITKPNGTELFNSSNKLVHRKFYATGSVTLRNVYDPYQGPSKVLLFNTQSFNKDKDFPVVYINVSSGTCNVADLYLNADIQLNFPLLVHFTHSTTEAKFIRYVQLMYNLREHIYFGNPTPLLEFQLLTTHSRANNGVSFHSALSTSEGLENITFSYKFYLLSYQ